MVPSAAGGSGGALTALAEACEALGEACASSAMVFLMHSVTAATIAAGGGDAAEDVLRGMATGELLGTLAFSERGTGAHFYAPELQAVRSNGGVRVSGRKSFVTSGGEADVYLLLVQGESEGSADAFLLRRRPARPGLRAEAGRAWGWPATPASRMELEDVELEDAARIGAPGGGTDLVFQRRGALLPGRPLGRERGHRRRRGQRRDGARQGRARYPDGSSLAEIQYDPARDSRHGHRRAHGPAARPRGGAARGGRRRVGAGGDHGGEGRRDRDRSRGDAAARSRSPAARATRPRCRSSGTCGTHARAP